MPKRRKVERIEKSIVYTVDEICTRVGCAKTTVRKLGTELGLPIYDDVSPALVLGADVRRAFKAAEEKPKMAPSKMFCFRCKAGRIPDLDQMQLLDQEDGTKRIVAPCRTCGTVMNRISRASDVPRFRRAIEDAMKNALFDWVRRDRT